jgi:hypothetical protein
MYCPTCATPSIEGAKFCKSCGLNLNIITQALGGGVVVSDPARDREFKKARKQISDGIQGSAVGAALLIAAAFPYFLIKPLNTWVYTVILILALAGIIKLFRSVGGIVDAKIGPKLLDPALQPRATGALAPSQAGASAAVNVRPSQRLAADTQKPAAPAPNTRHVAPDNGASATSIPSTPPPVESPPPRIGTGRINREHSSHLRRLENDDLMSKLRN